MNEDILVVPLDGIGETVPDIFSEHRQRLLEHVRIVERERGIVPARGLLDQPFERRSPAVICPPNISFCRTAGIGQCQRRPSITSGLPSKAGHEITNVRLTPDFVRFTPVNGHYSGTPICLLLTHNGHREHS